MGKDEVTVADFLGGRSARVVKLHKVNKFVYDMAGRILMVIRAVWAEW